MVESNPKFIAKIDPSWVEGKYPGQMKQPDQLVVEYYTEVARLWSKVFPENDITTTWGIVHGRFPNFRVFLKLVVEVR